MFFTTIMEIHKHFQKARIFQNYFFMAKSTVVQPPLLVRLATVLVLEAGGKPSTWFPPGGLVEPTAPPQIFKGSFKMTFWKKIKFAKNLEIMKIIKFT